MVFKFHLLHEIQHDQEQNCEPTIVNTSVSINSKVDSLKKDVIPY